MDRGSLPDHRGDGAAVTTLTGSENEILEKRPATRHRARVRPSRRRRVLRRLRVLRLLCPLVLLPALLLPGLSASHEVPSDIVIQTYLRPTADRVELLIRAPFEAMRDLDVPVRGPGYIDVDATMPLLTDAAETWLANFVTVYADGVALTEWQIEAARLSLPSDRSFRRFDSARAHVEGALEVSTELYRDQALMDVLLTFPGVRDGAEIAIEPRFAQLGLNTTTVLHFLPAEGVQRVYELSGNPGLVPLDPRWHQAFFRFVRLGVDHIFGGIDHILFLLCLIVPFRRWRPLVAIVTAFTLAHSITLVASALGLAPRGAWFPPLIETLIAASIVYMAIENLVGTRWNRRWAIAFAFGLVHGFGFSFALGETLQFAGRHLFTSLFAFNLGVELGQLMLLALAVPLLNIVLRTARAERIGMLVLSILLAHSGWHWMSDRAAALIEIGIAVPSFDAALLAAAMRLAMLALIVGLALWLLNGLARRLADSGTTMLPDREPPLG